MFFLTINRRLAGNLARAMTLSGLDKRQIGKALGVESEYCFQKLGEKKLHRLALWELQAIADLTGKPLAKILEDIV